LQGFALLGVLSVTTHSALAQTFYVGDMSDYGQSCSVPEDQISRVTSGMVSILKSRGWSGDRFVESDVWPQDITESCSSAYGRGGLDSTYGDTRNLVVVAGHGNTGMVGYGTVHNSMCTVDLGKSSNTKYQGVPRLGQMDGGTASIAMWLTCCTLRKESLAAHANFQWVKQQIGFHGESSFDTDMVSAFTRNAGAPARVGYISNKEAWGTAMEDKPGWFTGDNSTIVVSYGANSTEAHANHDGLTLNAGSYPRRKGGPACGDGPPGFTYTYTLKDHGADGCD
jgi:hypothetical protein